MRRNFYVIPLALSALALASCGGKKSLHGFEKLNNIIMESESTLNRYNEVSEIKDDSKVIYSKITDFKLIRGEKLKTDVEVEEFKLSDNGEGLLPTRNVKYTTYGDKKFEMVNNELLTSDYKVPTYMLIFVLDEEFFDGDYTLTDDNDKMTFKAKIKNDKIGSFFTNKSVDGLEDLNIDIETKNDKLLSFNASYKTKNKNNASISVQYDYPVAFEGTTDYIDAVFHLEGGISQNVTGPIKMAYDFQGATEMKIYDPNEVKENNIEKVGYHIEGWYKTKNTEADGSITYTDRWDFENDRMPREGVELYAHWMKDTTHTYGVYYKDSNNNDIKVGYYIVKEGDKFDDYKKFGKKVSGYTAVGYLDESLKPWNNNFTHPGGDEDLEVKVFLNLIPGEFEMVGSSRELNSAKAKNIYLTKDIDFRGRNLSFGDYIGIIKGNNHKIYNFNLAYTSDRNSVIPDLTDPNAEAKDHLYISLFKSVSTKINNLHKESCLIENVTFDEMKVVINTTNKDVKYIVFTPFATIADNVTIKNVTVNATVSIKRITAGAKVTIINDLVHVNNNSTITNSKVTVKEIE